MKLAVCYKWVIDETDILVDQETRTLNTKRAKYKISEIDRNALALAADLKADDGSLIAMTAGPDTKKSTKDALSRGADAVYYIESDELESSAAAKVLTAMIKKEGDVDFVICGEGSSDQYSQQVGPRIAALLGWNLATYASSVQKEENGLTIVRKLENEIETLSVQAPAVITVVSEINQPKAPGMKQILAARKKPAKALSMDDLNIDKEMIDTPVHVLNVGPSVMQRKKIRLNDGDVSTQEAARELVKVLKQDKTI